MRSIATTLLGGLAFVVTYVLLDWASYLHPMYGLNITPWNPSLALGLVIWFRAGKLVAIPWFVAILIGEVVVRGLPASLPLTLALSGVLTVGYGIMAEVLRRHAAGVILHDRRRLLSWLGIVVAGTLVTSTIYISLLYFTGLIPVGDWGVALVRFWVGDCVGIVVTMPFFWLLLDGHARLSKLFARWETAGYGVLAVAALWLSFGLGGEGEFQYFYLLFLPIVWAAARQGVPGAAIAAFILQAGIMVAVHWQNLVAVTVFELQLLGAVLAFVGLFIGAVVDEKQRVSNELRQTLRLAAAGEMAAALAHELNQPLTALSAYGAACQQMLEQGGNEERLRDTIGRMVTESYRAADVVRRLRDFFRTGATRLERIALAKLVDSVLAQFADKAASQGVELVAATMPDRTLLVDRLQVEVILRNLIANAFDAVLERSAGRRRIVITADDTDGESVRIRVVDSGPGLSADKVSRLFEAFQSSKSSGLGLGLAISRAIAQAHGGDLAAEAGDGGVFVLTLPIEGDDHDAA
ncbi:MAG: MASE1 domain-containing protein [Nitrosomonadales bacterium]|nr:MASE1 domain-containing protein [Nitrosomonadales bacterium]